MCMIALRPAGQVNIPNRVIDTAMDRHSDGFGLMWRDAKGLHTSTFGPRARKPFRKALKALDRSGVEYAAHFRWATSGPKDAEFAHPYTYNDPDPSVGTVAVMHNGVIDIRHDHAKESDTSVFVELVLAELPSRWWDNPALAYLVTEAIGYSKLTIMTATETVNLNDDRGEWDGGIWYSSNHKPAVKYTSPTWTKTTPSYAGEYSPVPGDVTAPKHGTDEYREKYGYWDNDAQKFIDGRLTTERKAREAAEKASALTAANGYTVGTDGTVLALLPGGESCAADALDLYKGKARKSAAALGLLETPDRVVRNVDGVNLRHGGHPLSSIVDIRLDGDRDYEDGVVCDVCHTVGTVYVMDGQPWIDMGHVVGSDNEDDDTVGLTDDVPDGFTLVSAAVLA